MDGKKYNCADCARSFSSKQSLNGHIDSLHKGMKPHKCPICDDCFAQKSVMNRHISSVHDGKMANTCTVCFISLSSMQALKNHIATVHEKKKPFNCSICDRDFSDKGTLKKHILEMYKGPSFRYQVFGTTSSFLSKFGLKKNIRDFLKKICPNLRLFRTSMSESKVVPDKYFRI